MSTFAEGDDVKWKWGDGWGYGTVETVYVAKTTREIKGTEVTREASEDQPAYFISQEGGDHVLKSHSEVQKKS